MLDASAQVDAARPADVVERDGRQDAFVPDRARPNQPTLVPTEPPTTSSIPPPVPRPFGDLRPWPGDDVRYTTLVFSSDERSPGIRLDARGTLWALNGWFTARTNGTVSRRLLSGIDRAGNIVAEVPIEGSVRIDQFEAHDDGIYLLGSARGAASIRGVPIVSSEGQFVASFDRQGMLRWLRSLAGASGSAALAEHQGRPTLVAWVRRGTDGSGLWPAIDGDRLLRIDLDTSGSVVRTVSLTGASDRSTVVGAVVHGTNRLTTRHLVGGDALEVVAWSDDGQPLWRMRRAGSIAIARDGQVAVHGVLDAEGACGTRALNSAPAGEAEESCAEIFHEGRSILRLSPIDYQRYGSRPPSTQGSSVWVGATPQAFLFGTYSWREQVPWPRCASAGVVDRWSTIRTQEGRGTHAIVSSDGQWRGVDAVTLGGGRQCAARRYATNDGRRRGAWELIPTHVISCIPLQQTPEFISVETACAGRPANLATDPANCGLCGHACSASPDGVAESCREGVCVAVGCVAARGDCDEQTANGCEADLSRDVTHCGVCGNACAAGAQCENGRCCAGGACASPYPSTGAAGVFAPQRDVTLRAGRHDFSTIHVPAGVTVRVGAGGVLDLRAQGVVRIEGTLDLRGGDGSTDCTATSGGTAGTRGGPGDGACALTPGAGPAGGSSVNVAPLPYSAFECHSTLCADSPTVGPWPDVYDAESGLSCFNCLHDHCRSPWVQSSRADGGAIGRAAILDRAVQTTFYPGSGGGYCFHQEHNLGATGGGGGGALRISSPHAIEIGPSANLLVVGGSGGGTATAPALGGAGSGGVIVVSAPAVHVSSRATLNATSPQRGGLGRIRISVDPARCVLDGNLQPPPRRGCEPVAVEDAFGHTLITRWPY